MAKRPKTRIHHLADALDQLEKTHASLMAIDLRTCPREMKPLVKASREVTAQAIAVITTAMEAEVPAAPRVFARSDRG